MWGLADWGILDSLGHLTLLYHLCLRALHLLPAEGDHWEACSKSRALALSDHAAILMDTSSTQWRL